MVALEQLFKAIKFVYLYVVVSDEFLSRWRIFFTDENICRQIFLTDGFFTDEVLPQSFCLYRLCRFNHIVTKKKQHIFFVPNIVVVRYQKKELLWPNRPKLNCWTFKKSFEDLLQWCTALKESRATVNVVRLVILFWYTVCPRKK